MNHLRISEGYRWGQTHWNPCSRSLRAPCWERWELFGSLRHGMIRPHLTLSFHVVCLFQRISKIKQKLSQIQFEYLGDHSSDESLFSSDSDNDNNVSKNENGCSLLLKYCINKFILIIDNTKSSNSNRKTKKKKKKKQLQQKNHVEQNSRRIQEERKSFSAREVFDFLIFCFVSQYKFYNLIVNF